MATLQTSETIHVRNCGITYAIPSEKFKEVFGSQLHVFIKESRSFYTITRPRTAFEAILEYCITGTLHLPEMSCPTVFLNELKYWKIRDDVLDGCCYKKICSFKRNMKSIQKFEKMCSDVKVVGSDKRSIKTKLWKIVDYQDNSLAAKVYFFVSACVILMSVGSISFSSLTRDDMSGNSTIIENNASDAPPLKNLNAFPSPTEPTIIQRFPTFIDIRVNCNKCYRKKAPCRTIPKAEKTSVDDTFVKYTTTPCCSTIVHTLSSLSIDPVPLARTDADVNSTHLGNNTLNNDSIPETNTRINTMSGLSEEPISLVRADEDINSFPQVDQENRTSKNISTKEEWHSRIGSDIVIALQTSLVQKLPGLEMFNFDTFELKTYIEMIVVGFFTLDLLIRLVTCPNRTVYFLSILNSIEAILLLANYGQVVLGVTNCVERDNIWLQIMHYIQIFRIIRLFRIIREVTAFKVLKFSLISGVKDLLVLLLYMTITIVLFANFMYFVEQDDSFPSIPHAWWYCIITMTTVGYGDMYPRSAVGKVIGSFCALSGVIMFSLIIPVFVNTFLCIYEYADSLSPAEHSKQLPDEIKENQSQSIKLEMKDSNGDGHEENDDKPNTMTLQ